MIDRATIWKIVEEEYDLTNVMIGAIGSHSALDICDGAIAEGYRTFIVAQQGREKTYAKYFRVERDTTGNIRKGVVDEILVLDKFQSILKPENLALLRKRNVLFVPNRSFTSYVKIDRIESEFTIPIVGSRAMLRTEERGIDHDYYWLLERAGLPYPEKIENPEDINELVIVKLPHAKKRLERGFFTASGYEEFKKKAEDLIAQQIITAEDLAKARIERYIIGPVFNLDFFYSPLTEKGNNIELLGVDWRFETSLDGHVRLPAVQQLTLTGTQKLPEYTVCGHNFATLRESLIEHAFELAEKYVKATQEYYPPGIIGPFCLQTCVDKDLNFYIYDLAPRIGGGTNVHSAIGHPYGNMLWRQPMSTGRRIALEIKLAIEMDKLKLILT